MSARTRLTLSMSHFKGSAYYNVTENQHDTITFNQMTCSGADWMPFAHLDASWNGLEKSSFGCLLDQWAFTLVFLGLTLSGQEPWPGE